MKENTSDSSKLNNCPPVLFATNFKGLIFAFVVLTKTKTGEEGISFGISALSVLKPSVKNKILSHPKKYIVKTS